MYSFRDLKQLVGQQHALQHLSGYNIDTVIQPENKGKDTNKKIIGVVMSTGAFCSECTINNIMITQIEQIKVNTMLTTVIGAEIIR